MPAKKTTKKEIATTHPATLGLSNVQVFPLKEPAGKTRAFARLIIADQLQLTGLRIVDGANGLFVSYPNDPAYRGDDYRSLFYPVTRELRDAIEEAVISQYCQILQKEESR